MEHRPSRSPDEEDEAGTKQPPPTFQITCTERTFGLDAFASATWTDPNAVHTNEDMKESEQWFDVKQLGEDGWGRTIRHAQSQPGAYLVQGESVSRAGTPTMADGELERTRSAQSQPGAYSVQGANVARVGAQLALDDETQNEGSNTQESLYEIITGSHQIVTTEPCAYSMRYDSVLRSIVETMGGDDEDENYEAPAHSAAAQPPAAHSQLAVAAELATDVEAEIEDKVRKRIMKETTAASVVLVEPIDKGTAKKLNKHRNVKERFFGDTRQTPNISAAADRCIRRREFLPWNVEQNSTTKQWVTSIQTKQKSTDPRELQRSIQRFISSSEDEAYELGLAMASPRMQPLEDDPNCFLCQSNFAVFRRPSHCRNCGVCICSPCSTNWPSKMIPSTFNVKNESVVNVCRACDWLASQFQKALLEGDFSKAMNLYRTGNVNLRTPYYVDKRSTEVFHPIHMAILGKNLDLVKWLASERHCPLRTTHQRKGGYPLVTSKGRSPLRLALPHLDILQYLVAEMNQDLSEEELSYRSVIKHLAFLLKHTDLPESKAPRKSDPVDMLMKCHSTASISTRRCSF